MIGSEFFIGAHFLSFLKKFRAHNQNGADVRYIYSADQETDEMTDGHFSSSTIKTIINPIKRLKKGGSQDINTKERIEIDTPVTMRY